MLQERQISFLLHKMQISMSILFLVLLPQIILVGAQWEAPPPSNVPNFSNFTPSMIIIIVVFIGAFFFLVLFSIYLHCCTNSSDDDNVVPRAGSLRSRRASTTRGLDASVIETFPTFLYTEVKDHKIGNRALECAVCLNEFEDEEMLRLIPKCDHVFHPDCIDVWLESHVTCPVCRADLVPKPGDEPVQTPVITHVERSGSRNGEVVVQVDGNGCNQEPRMNRNLSFDYANQLRKSWSVRMFGSDKFRSHSTGHSLVKPRENLERFTLKLPTQVRNEVIHRAALNRAKSCAIVLPREVSLRSGYRRDWSNQNGRFYPNIERWSDRRAKSVQWNFLTRGFSVRSPKMRVATDQESSTKGIERRTHVKMPSLNCLEPKAVDEVSLFSNVLMHDYQDFKVDNIFHS